jgi:hypothetical protein
LPKEGLYEVMVSYTPRANRATNVPVTISGKNGPTTVYVNQTLAPTVDKVFTPVGKFLFEGGSSGSVTIANEGTKGFVVADAVRFVPVDQSKPRGPATEPANPESALLSYHELEREVLDFRNKRPILPQAMGVEEGRIQDCRLPAEGDLDRFSQEEVPRGFLSALGTPDSTLYAITDETSGRLELANWMVNPQNPLTPRVAVNRIWLNLFGEGLVETPDDFGTHGAAPRSVQLLDYLSRRFVDQGWSVKKLIREIMLSNTYQMSSGDEAATAAWGARRRTLPPEVLRDAILAVTRDLDTAAGGPWISTNRGRLLPAQAARRAQTTSRRRSVYVPVIRNVTSDLLGLLANPEGEPDISSSGRSSSGAGLARKFLQDCVADWADALQHGAATNQTQRITLAYRQALGRAPSQAEAAQAAQLLSTAKSADLEATTSALESFCRGLLTSRAFREF